MPGRTIQRLLRDRKGGTAIEYGLIVALIVITMVVAFVEVADQTTSIWSNVSSKVSRAG